MQLAWDASVKGCCKAPFLLSAVHPDPGVLGVELGRLAEETGLWQAAPSQGSICYVDQLLFRRMQHHLALQQPWRLVKTTHCIPQGQQHQP